MKIEKKSPLFLKMGWYCFFDLLSLIISKPGWSATNCRGARGLFCPELFQQLLESKNLSLKNENKWTGNRLTLVEQAVSARINKNLHSWPLENWLRAESWHRRWYSRRLNGRFSSGHKPNWALGFHKHCQSVDFSTLDSINTKYFGERARVHRQKKRIIILRYLTVEAIPSFTSVLAQC